MSNDPNNLPIPAPADDGYGDALDADRVIQGVIIKCVDGHWSDRDGVAFPPDTKMLAISTAICLQCWKDGQPVETIVKQPNQPLPDIGALNAKIPETEWELGLNNAPKPPWELCFVVHLVDPTDASIYTYINSTFGARIAFDRLKSKVNTMRQLRGELVVPLVKLDSKPMKTKWGTKQRPDFKIVDWRQLGGGGGGNISGGGGGPKQITSGSEALPKVEEPSKDEEFNDEIPHL